MLGEKIQKSFFSVFFDQKTHSSQKINIFERTKSLRGIEKYTKTVYNIPGNTKKQKNVKYIRRLAFEYCGMFIDPELAYTESMEYYEGEQAKAQITNDNNQDETDDDQREESDDV
jgi:hypothetical protein